MCPKQFLYYIEIICRRACKKTHVWISHHQLVSRPPKSGCFFWKIFVELVWKSCAGRNNSLELPVFWFSNSLPYGLEESRELRAFWLVGFRVSRHSKMQKISASNFFFLFLSHHYGFLNCFEILNFAFSITIPRGILQCKILTF